MLAALADQPVPVTIMAVRKIPMSGSAEEQRAFAEISADAIVKTVEQTLADGKKSRGVLTNQH